MPVSFSVGRMPVSKVDMILTVSNRNGKLGELHVSAGGVDWWSKGAHNQKHFYRWARLADLLENEGRTKTGTRVPKRAPRARSKRVSATRRRRTPVA